MTHNVICGIIPTKFITDLTVTRMASWVMQCWKQKVKSTSKFFTLWPNVISVTDHSSFSPAPIGDPVRRWSTTISLQSRYSRAGCEIALRSRCILLVRRTLLCEGGKRNWAICLIYWCEWLFQNSVEWMLWTLIRRVKSERKSNERTISDRFRTPSNPNAKSLSFSSCMPPITLSVLTFAIFQTFSVYNCSTTSFRIPQERCLPSTFCTPYISHCASGKIWTSLL